MRGLEIAGYCALIWDLDVVVGVKRVFEVFEMVQILVGCR
jgi:hypothetical protein